MKANEHFSMIDSEKRLGTVAKVTASGIELNLPQALAAVGRRGLARGTVGEFVFIDCDRAIVLGRIVEVQVPHRNRPALERQVEREQVVEPVGRVQLLATVRKQFWSTGIRRAWKVGRVQLLATVRKTTQIVVRGVLVSPKIGDGVFKVNGPMLSRLIQTALLGGIGVEESAAPLTVSLGRISGIGAADIALPPERLFGRHCGIFGATGGGKSWTMATLAGEVNRLGGKAIVINPTGEFTGKLQGAKEYAFTRKEDDQILVRFPPEKMSELSLFTLLRPTGRSQGPTMREAIKSLRLARVLREDEDNTQEVIGDQTKYSNDAFGSVFIEQDETIKKTGQLIRNFNRACELYSTVMTSQTCNFDVQRLAVQIIHECIVPNNGQGHARFGGQSETVLGYCNTLIVRINEMLTSPELQCLFGSQGEDICNKLGAFLDDPKQRICLISFKNVSFNHNARELLLNTIGEHLLKLAREDRFRSQPVICFLDEAHQFMGRSVGDEFNSVSLDAFGLIAKEGRKHGLATVIATQRPRDVPQDVLSQLGTLFVHRLTNDRDRETIERACGELDRSATAFIPSLSEGEAIVLGSDLPAPLPIQIRPPEKSAQPTSHGPNYQSAWRNTGV